jgi:hypothetical protein
MIAARHAAPARRGPGVSLGSGLALLVALGALGLLALSLVPPSALAARLLGVAGESRSGSYTQELYAQLGDRLRLAGGGLLTAAVLLVPLRASLTEMLLRAVHDVRSRPALRIPRIVSVEVGLLMVLALGLRLAFLGQPMRYDEAITYNEFASRPLYYGLSFYPEPNNHLLNTLLVYVSSQVLGGEPWALRLPALVAGVLLAPATYALGWLLRGRAAGLLAASLVASSSYLIEYSTNARGYSMQALAFAVAFCLAIWAARWGSATALLLAAVCATLGFWAVPTMLYGVAVIGAWLAREALAGVRRLTWSVVLVTALLVGLLTFALYLPVIVVSGPERLVGNRFVEPLGAPELARDLATSLRRTWAFWNRDLPAAVTWLLLAGVAWDTWEAVRRRCVPLALLATGPCLLLVLVQRVAPFERVWLFLLPLYFVLASGGLLGVAGRVLRVPRWAGAAGSLGLGCLLGGLVLTSGSILASRETGAFPEAEAVARTLRGRLSATDAVVTLLPASLPELQYYFGREGLPREALVRPPEAASRVFVVATAEPVLPGRQPAVVEARFPSATLYRLD